MLVVFLEGLSIDSRFSLDVRGKTKFALSFPSSECMVERWFAGPRGDTDMHRTHVNHRWKDLAKNQRTWPKHKGEDSAAARFAKRIRSSS